MQYDELDNYDRAILRVLSADGRISITDLAERIGLSKTPTQLRVKRLEERGIIMGYQVILDPIKLGAAHVAYVEVKLDDTREPALQAFNAAAKKIAEIEEVYMIASRFDYLLKVRTKDMVAFRAILGEKISALPHFASSSTHVAMEAVKDGGAGQFLP